MIDPPDTFPDFAQTPRRSALSVPAINRRALEKSRTLGCDMVIFDLEDSVAPGRKAEARAMLADFFAAFPPPSGQEQVIRINPLDSAEGEADLALVIRLKPAAILLPKVETPGMIAALADRLSEDDAADDLRILAMIETPRGVLNAGLIAEACHTRGMRLAGFVVGLNDLRKATGIRPQPDRQFLVPYLMQILLAARAYGLVALDSVSNDFRDLAAFGAECAAGAAMGFDGKMLIHPDQIAAANRHFGPSPEALAEAKAIRAAFADPAAAGLGVVQIEGRMVERLHLEAAERLLALQHQIDNRTLPA